MIRAKNGWVRFTTQAKNGERKIKSPEGGKIQATNT